MSELEPERVGRTGQLDSAAAESGAASLGEDPTPEPKTSTIGGGVGPAPDPSLVAPDPSRVAPDPSRVARDPSPVAPDASPAVTDPSRAGLDTSPAAGPPMRAVLQELDGLADKPVAEHPGVYQRVHSELQGALSDIDDA